MIKSAHPYVPHHHHRSEPTYLVRAGAARLAVVLDGKAVVEQEAVVTLLAVRVVDL